MKDIKEFFTQDRYAKLSGIELLSVSPGHAVAQMPIHPHHFNAVGSVQGGAIFTLADFAFAAASNAHGKVAVGINVSITYMKAVSSGTLRAEAREVSANPKLASYTVNITDEHNTLIAVFQGLVYRKDQPLPWAPKK
ncbi:MAG: PaaI family thioesterase [Verrucomicrobiia bacterium]